MANLPHQFTGHLPLPFCSSWTHSNTACYDITQRFSCQSFWLTCQIVGGSRSVRLGIRWFIHTLLPQLGRGPWQSTCWTPPEHVALLVWRRLGIKKEVTESDLHCSTLSIINKFHHGNWCIYQVWCCWQARVYCVPVGSCLDKSQVVGYATLPVWTSIRQTCTTNNSQKPALLYIK